MDAERPRRMYANAGTAWHMLPHAGLALIGRQITLIVKAADVLSP
ncbi:hypothetical protein ABID47_001688 [Paenibacillus favisporus]|uniref:Uncharacterized protein n=1 Tax=Paenibacillus favisporus TaxID=221028 RepID=A0ABV2F013_9BACL